MVSIGYLIKRISKMDKGAMFRKINSIHEKTGKSKVYLFFDMINCSKYGAGYMDYDLFEMYNLSSKQRNTYITRGRNNAIDKKLNNKAYIDEVEIKNKFNKNFNKFLKRDWIFVSDSSKEDVINFFKKHNTFMAKPIDGMCGKNIEKIKVSDYENLDELYNYFEGKNFVLEEVIKQHEDISAIYPNAINTLRVVSILKDRKSTYCNNIF